MRVRHDPWGPSSAGVAIRYERPRFWILEKAAEVQAAEERTEAEVTDLTVEVKALRQDIAETRQGQRKVVR